MNNKLKSIWRLIADGLASIGSGMSTFTLWPDTDYEKYVRDFSKKHLSEVPGFDEYQRTLDDYKQSAEATSQASKKPAR